MGVLEQRGAGNQGVLEGCFNSSQRIPGLHQEAENEKPEKVWEGPKIYFIAFGQRKLKRKKNWERNCDSVLLFNFLMKNQNSRKRKSTCFNFVENPIFHEK